MSERHPLADFGFAPGNYLCRCIEPDCSTISAYMGELGVFDGEKRAFRCEPCARKAAAAYVPPSPSAVAPDVLAVLKAAMLLLLSGKGDDADQIAVSRRRFDRFAAALSALSPDVRALLETPDDR